MAVIITVTRNDATLTDAQLIGDLLSDIRELGDPHCEVTAVDLIALERRDIVPDCRRYIVFGREN